MAVDVTKSARASGMIMGHAVNPLVHQGDSLIHVGEMQ